MQRDRLNRLLQRSRDAAFALTVRGEVWTWNVAAEALTGFRAAEIVHESFAARIEAHGPLGKPLDADYCERVIRDGSAASFERLPPCVASWAPSGTSGTSVAPQASFPGYATSFGGWPA